MLTNGDEGVTAHHEISKCPKFLDLRFITLIKKRN